MMERTTSDLIDELKTESKNFSFTALVVGFEKRTEFIWATEEEKLLKLNGLVQDGGEPVGLIGVATENGLGTFYCRPLSELEQEAWVGNYLHALFESVKAMLIATGKATGLENSSRWIN